MSARRILQLREATRSSSEDLSRSEARWLIELGIADVSPGARSGWELRVRNKVGVVQHGDLVIEVAPKLPVARVLWMLQEASMTPDWTRDAAPLSDDATLTDAVIELYLRSVKRLILRSGLHHGYIGVDDTSWTLRGRVRMGHQLTRHLGQALPLEVHYDDYSLDTPANRTLAAALSKVFQLAPEAPGNSQLAARAHALLARFEGVSLPPHWTIPPVDATLRLPEAYGAPLMIARLILSGGSLDSAAGARPGEGFLLSMPQVFERCAASILRRVHGAGLSTQATLAYGTNEAGSPTGRIRPDAVLAGADGQAAVVLDTKYKRAEPKPSDLYQMHVYARSFDVQDAVLLYAEHIDPRTLLLEGSAPGASDAIRLHVRGVDLTMHEDEIRHHILAAASLS